MSKTIYVIIFIATIFVLFGKTFANPDTQTQNNVKSCQYSWDDPTDGCYTSNDLACPEVQVKNGIDAKCESDKDNTMYNIQQTPEAEDPQAVYYGK